jgi:hypothetical protein
MNFGELFSMFDDELLRHSPEEGKSLAYTDDVARLITNISEQQTTMTNAGFDAKFLLVNRKNYERLVAYAHEFFPSITNSDGLIDEIFGLTVVVWDVPIDYVNVRAKASVEFAYEEKTLRRGEW